MRTSRLLQSTSARLSLAYAALIVAAFFVSGVVIWIAARDTAESELRQDIELEVNAIETELETEGLEAAIAAIEARAEHPGAFEYWVTGTDGKHLVGDFPDMQGPAGWRHMIVSDAADGAESREEMLVLTERLGDGVMLSVGDDIGRARAVQDSVLVTLGWIGGGTLLTCLLVGVLVTKRVLSRMEMLDTTLAKVAAGDIEARFPVQRGSGSDIERVGAAVNAMLDRIERLVADVRRVSRDIAHDLRTPITHLQQRLEEANAAPGRADRLAAIEGAQAKVGEILRTFDALLRLSEIEAGPARQRMKAVDLATVGERVVDAYRPDAEESGHHLTLSVTPARPVVGDVDLLTQALANLIENAMHHTPTGTRIDVRIGDDGAVVRLAVVDNGPGIPGEDRQRVLEPFVRLDQSRTTPGSGLGFSLVAAIARFHGAKLTLANSGPGLAASLEFAPIRP